MISTVKAYVGVTDGDWYRFLAGRPDLTEVNFWRPAGARAFKALTLGEPFFFKTHMPHNRVVGGGFFSGFAPLRVSVAWSFYGEANGTASLALALIALPLTAAQAQPSVRSGDLNLASDAGQAAFAHRLNVAAEQVCGAEKNFSIQYACQAGVRAEVTEKLAAITPATQFAAVPASHVQPSVRIADLNLASTAGKSDFDHRVNAAADRVCRDERNLTIQAGCRLAVRAEATEKLAMITSGAQYAAR